MTLSSFFSLITMNLTGRTLCKVNVYIYLFICVYLANKISSPKCIGYTQLSLDSNFDSSLSDNAVNKPLVMVPLHAPTEESWGG
jgi:hypothetical protein